MSSIDQNRGPGELMVGDALRALLAGARAAAGVTSAPQLPVDGVRGVEGAVGIRFEDDLLAVWCAGIPALRDRHGLELGRVVAHTGELRERGVRGDRIGIGRVDATVFLAIPMQPRTGAATELILCDTETRRERATALLDWLREVLEVGPAAGELRPRLTPRMTESYELGRRVRHKVFGEGRVLVDRGSGPNRTVKADFPGHGLKLLQARFLEFLE